MFSSTSALHSVLHSTTLSSPEQSCQGKVSGDASLSGGSAVKPHEDCRTTLSYFTFSRHSEHREPFPMPRKKKKRGLFSKAGRLTLGRASTELPTRRRAGLWCSVIHRDGHPVRDLQRAQGKAAAAWPSLASNRRGLKPAAGWRQAACGLPEREKYPIYICLYVYVLLQSNSKLQA